MLALLACYPKALILTGYFIPSFFLAVFVGYTCMLPDLFFRDLSVLFILANPKLLFVLFHTRSGVTCSKITLRVEELNKLDRLSLSRLSVLETFYVAAGWRRVAYVNSLICELEAFGKCIFMLSLDTLETLILLFREPCSVLTVILLGFFLFAVLLLCCPCSASLRIELLGNCYRLFIYGCHLYIYQKI